MKWFPLAFSNVNCLVWLLTLLYFNISQFNYAYSVNSSMLLFVDFLVCCLTSFSARPVVIADLHKWTSSRGLILVIEYITKLFNVSLFVSAIIIDLKKRLNTLIAFLFYLFIQINRMTYFCYYQYCNSSVLFFGHVSKMKNIFKIWNVFSYVIVSWLFLVDEGCFLTWC